MNKTEFIVIGAGILGASTAYYLAKHGARVTIIDRKDAGQATDAGAGMICPWVSQRRNKNWYKLAKGGAELYPRLVEELARDGETETGYKRVGALFLHDMDSKLQEKYNRAIKRREDAPEIGEVAILDEQQTHQMFPLLSNRHKSVYISGGARVDGRAMRDALIRGAKKHGAQKINGAAKLMYKENRISGVSIGNTVVEADTVIATSGAWMNELLHPLDVKFAAVPQKGQILHVKPSDSDTSSEWPVVIPPGGKLIIGFDDRIVIGSTHEKDKGFDNRVTVNGMHELLGDTVYVAPGLRDCTILETRVGFRPFTPGFLPVIGPLPQFEGLLLANGLGSSGLTSGPYVGKQLAYLALDKEMEIDITNYDVAGALK